MIYAHERNFFAACRVAVRKALLFRYRFKIFHRGLPHSSAVGLARPSSHQKINGARVSGRQSDLILSAASRLHYSYPPRLGRASPTALVCGKPLQNASLTALPKCIEHKAAAISYRLLTRKADGIKREKSSQTCGRMVIM